VRSAKPPLSPVPGTPAKRSLLSRLTFRSAVKGPEPAPAAAFMTRKRTVAGRALRFLPSRLTVKFNRAGAEVPAVRVNY